MHPYLVASGATVALLGLLLAAEARDSHTMRWLVKPLASLGFLVAALSAGTPGSGFGQVLVGALALCMVGDVLLIPAARAAFLAGLGAFLCGHVLFAVSFGLRGVSWAGAAGAALAVLPLAWLVRRWLRPHLPAGMQAPVTAYIAAISVMVCMAAGTAVARGGEQGALVAGGSVAFFLSDISVARDRFVSPGIGNRLWGLPLYYGAQLALAAAVALCR